MAYILTPLAAHRTLASILGTATCWLSVLSSPASSSITSGFRNP